jgi:cytochrome c peroxidase
MSSGGQVTVMSAKSTAGQPPTTTNCTTPETSLAIAGQVTAVAFNPNRDSTTSYRQNVWLVAQSREPAQLIFIEPSQSQVIVDLGGSSMLDTGHDIFHRDAGSGIACAQCHAEGGDDGRVWKFTLTGPRRTQALHVGLAGTEPFHWDGDMSDLSALMEQVFVGRMGGPKETPAREQALDGWLAGLKPPAAIGDAASPRAALGKALFESAEVGCSSCHSGVKLTNNANVYVGTTDPGHLVQVPSLVGIAYRGPFLHDGCAATLRDRFDPKCGGGDLHGNTSRLTDEQLDDLVAYLETL